MFGSNVSKKKFFFYIATLSCGPPLITNLSFYSSSVLPTNPFLRSETRPHIVSTFVDVPNSTVPRLSTPERGSQSSPIPEPHLSQSSPIPQPSPPPAPIRSAAARSKPPAANYSSVGRPVSRPSRHHLLGTRKPRPRHQFLTGRPLYRVASPPGHAPRRQLLLTASVRPHRRSESSLRRSESRLASTVVVVPQICSTLPPAAKLALTIVVEPDEQEEVSCRLPTLSSFSPSSDRSSLLLQLPHVGRCDPRFGGSRCRFHTMHSTSSFAQDCLQVSYTLHVEVVAAVDTHPACLVVMIERKPNN
jgi:hypothetical protein